MPNIDERLKEVRLMLAEAADAAGRSADEITLLAVSKTKPASDIAQAYALGQRHFGENYVQELVEKAEALEDLDIEWHFIGPLQSNKTRPVARLCSWAHSIDRLKIARRLAEQRPTELPPLNICVQVNIDRQQTKAGCEVADAIDLCAAIADLRHLRLRGLMAIPAPDNAARAFADLANLQARINARCQLGMDTLSMGMSGDLRDAVAAGSTMVRIGTAIFGARD